MEEKLQYNLQSRNIEDKNLWNRHVEPAAQDAFESGPTKILESIMRLFYDFFF